MTTQKYPWIARKVADQIFERVVTAVNSPVIYFIQAPAGIGKTFLARDIGVRLGSPTGYEPSRRGNVTWSGILDIYDPDTNSNQGIERRLIEAFSQTGYEFEAYRDARSTYDIWFKGGIVGSSLEEQRRKVETAFAEGLKVASTQQTLVFAFDTIERLESAHDLSQQMQLDSDTTSVTDWLIYQITQRDKGAILLFGRLASRFYHRLCTALTEAHRPAPILLNLDALDADEARNFFADRVQRYPQLTQLLDENLETLLLERTKGNPLLLDLALLSLAESQNPRYVRQALGGQSDLQMVQKALLEAYLGAFSKLERPTLLRYLALARNGLFAELLHTLEPNHAETLFAELQEMATLPFIKVRDIYISVSGQEKRFLRRTFFLHDAVYALCDEVWLKPEEVRRDSQRLVDWYDAQTKTPSDADLLVESLFYRMRANPITGYQWYLRQADQAIRSTHTGLDMRLRDAMELFLISASTDSLEDHGQSLSSPIDRSNISVLMPGIFSDFRLDSVILWIKRYTMRGKTPQAVRIGEKELPWAEELFQKQPDRYRLAYAEYLLWYGQALMYGGDIEGALSYYKEVEDLLLEFHSDVSMERLLGNLNDFERWRLSLVAGRTYNNQGYTHWMYKGQYHLALQEFQQAVRLFRMPNLEIAGLEEELANTNDNMGRVHALLGSEFQAIQLIKKGLEMRKSLRLNYREALSTTSLALVLIRFGRVEQALKTVETAMIHFRRAEVSRGIGLGLLTRGMIYRSMADMYKELDLSLEEALKFTNLAESDLKDAVRYFSELVREPIREVQALNELACCYRARYLLLCHSNSGTNDKDMAFIQGRMYLRQAIDLADRYHYLIEQLDSMQDLAVLETRAEQYDDAERSLNAIRSRIPDRYVIQPRRGLAEISVSERVDAYYKLLGQVELLEGAIAYARGVCQTLEESVHGKQGQPTREAWLETARHYLLAVSYFNHYATEAFVRGITFARIYRRFADCAPALVREITQVYMPEWVETYGLSESLVHSLFRDVFGLFD